MPVEVYLFLALAAVVALAFVLVAATGLLRFVDPIGVGARSISECIILQLTQLDRDTPGLELAVTLARDHLDLVATRQHGELRRSLRVGEEELQSALALVKSCNPKPGLAVSPAATEYVIPDVFVRKVDKRWQVEISPTGVPRLSVNQTYANLLKGSGDHAVLAQVTVGAP